MMLIFSVLGFFNSVESIWQGKKFAGVNVTETLLKNEYYENCPGCKVDQHKAVQHGFPIKKLFTICLSWAQGRLDAAFLPGAQMVFFILNVVEAIGVAMTFKPFLVERQL
ncbi:hypothetical protein POM88_047167 [Heracleum sosnowskyi]|uniref:Uncharacterized protein n=1 Tax=Heracleum sosnowskyi TaxID=360622 RepID=A0AAD8H994_9APIA|nr:hypothetical protein POM88_047163 [Heracleum sosnowskyi]KAK1362691.1 hypothetical protein POM88_047165 [Heracleum sosnowskyi]KAK1362693.1 hypothetical protein POM88_047167 [Heracleum sosnowskyi]